MTNQDNQDKNKAQKSNALLRALPKVDQLLSSDYFKQFNFPQHILKQAISDTLELLRVRILNCDNDLFENNTDNLSKEYANKEGDKSNFLTQINDRIIKKAKELSHFNLRPVINATGIILHTNLGRSPLPPIAADHVAKIAKNYCTLEYDLTSGGRGSRYTAVEDLICQITGAEAALLTTNNAAAVLLMLSALCKKKQVIVSRGELVEIGGSFRVPDIMSAGGAILKEVGTTNKTKASDYQNAIEKGKTGAILKVHTSNYKIVGFFEEVGLNDLSMLAKTNDLPLLYDLGSGLLDCGQDLGLPCEPTAKDALSDGADIVCFSADKLFGGPQSGILVGKKDLIGRLKKHPLLRAVRVDKLALSALEAVLRLYLDKKNIYTNIPVLAMLNKTQSQLQKDANELCLLLNNYDIKGFDFSVVKTDNQVGGGSAPTLLLDSYAVQIRHAKMSANKIEQLLRLGDGTPVIARIKNDAVLLDLRTIAQSDFAEIAKKLFPQ